MQRVSRPEARVPWVLPGLRGLEDRGDRPEGMAGGTERGDQHGTALETKHAVAQATGQRRDQGEEVKLWIMAN